MIQAEVHLKENGGKIKSLPSTVGQADQMEQFTKLPGFLSFTPQPHPGIEASFVTIPVRNIAYISWIDVEE